MRRSPVAACLLALVLGGCAGGDDRAKPMRTFEPQNTASSPSPRATAADSDACKLLTSRERSSIAGEKLDVVTPVQVSKGTLQCRWVKSLSPPSAVSLTVESSAAETWAQSFPQTVDGAALTGQVDDKLMKRLRDAKKKVAARGAKLSGGEACGMFSLLLEVNTGRKGASVHVHTQPTGSGQVTAVAQKCTMGVYTLVTYSEPNLQQSYPLGQAMLRLIKIAHKRAIKVL